MDVSSLGVDGEEVAGGSEDVARLETCRVRAMMVIIASDACKKNDVVELDRAPCVYDVGGWDCASVAKYG